jgi:hypothetical protein
MSRARENADGARLDAPLASPAFTGTPTGITAAHLEAGVLPSDVTGGSGLTALGTVATGTIGGSSVVNTSGAITTTGAFTSVGIDDDATSATLKIQANQSMRLDQHGWWSGSMGFTNSVANQYVDVYFTGGSSFWTSGKIRLGGEYVNGNIGGLREYTFTYNAVSGSVYAAGIVDVTPSAVVGAATAFFAENWAWDSTNSRHYLRIKKANTVGNSVMINIEIYKTGWYTQYFSLGTLGTY